MAVKQTMNKELLHKIKPTLNVKLAINDLNTCI